MPGVYGMIDAEGQLIYVGKSKSLREDHEMLLLVSGWFRQCPEELSRTIAPDDAIQMCQL
ncbi:MAG: hypothetical protein HUU20_22385 [Pirellulales bacterium]|nr:hypothetical protein [Pirellulales bacterium]